MDYNWVEDIQKFCNEKAPPAPDPRPETNSPPVTPRHSTTASTLTQTAKKSTAKRGQAEQLTPPSTEKRRRLSIDWLNMSAIEKKPTMIQAGKKAVETIKEKAKKPLQKKIKLLEKKVEKQAKQIKDVKLALKTLMDQKALEEESCRDETVGDLDELGDSNTRAIYSRSSQRTNKLLNELGTLLGKHLCKAQQATTLIVPNPTDKASSPALGHRRRVPTMQYLPKISLRTSSPSPVTTNFSIQTLPFTDCLRRLVPMMR